MLAVAEEEIKLRKAIEEKRKAENKPKLALKSLNKSELEEFDAENKAHIQS